MAVITTYPYRWTQLPNSQIDAAGAAVRVLGDRSNKSVYFMKASTVNFGHGSSNYATGEVGTLEFDKLDDHNYACTPYGDRPWSFCRLRGLKLGDAEDAFFQYHDGGDHADPFPLDWAIKVTRNELSLFLRHRHGEKLTGVPAATNVAIGIRIEKATGASYSWASTHYVNDNDITNEYEIRFGLGTHTPFDTLEDGDPLYLRSVTNFGDYYVRKSFTESRPDLSRAALRVYPGVNEFTLERATVGSWYHCTDDYPSARFNLEGDEYPSS